MGLSSFKFLWWAPKDASFCSRVHISHSRSSKVVDFGTNRKGVCDFLLVVHSNYLAPFLRYGELLAENSEFSLPHSHLMPSLGMNPFKFLDEFFIPKTRVLGLSVGEDFVILACVVFTHCQRVTDRQTDIPIVANTGLA